MCTVRPLNRLGCAWRTQVVALSCVRSHTPGPNSQQPQCAGHAGQHKLPQSATQRQRGKRQARARGRPGRPTAQLRSQAAAHSRPAPPRRGHVAPRCRCSAGAGTADCPVRLTAAPGAAPYLSSCSGTGGGSADHAAVLAANAPAASWAAERARLSPERRTVPASPEHGCGPFITGARVPPLPMQP